MSVPLTVGTVGSDYLLMGAPDRRRAFAKRIAESRIDHLFIADHVSFHTGLGMDAMVNAATLAAMIPDMKIVIGVYLLALRHPVPVARQLSSLSLSAPGRIVLGVGVGGEDRHEMEICGVNPAERGKHTNHSLRALHNLLEGEKTSYDCQYFSFEGALIKPAPVPRIPVVIGGRSQAAIKRAAHLSDGWLGVWASPARYEQVIEEIDQLAQDAGRTDVEWQHGLQLWAGVGDDALGYLARGMERMYRVPFEKFEKYSPHGSPEAIAEFLSGYIDKGVRTFNIAAQGADEETCIDAVAEISELLHDAYPDL